jgi:hypothetical protein
MPFTSFLTAKRFLILKSESTTPGTAASITYSDFDTRFEDVKYAPKIEMDASKKLAVPDHGDYNDVPGAQSGEISASFRLCPGTSLVTPPKCGKGLLAGGMLGAVEGTTLGYSWSANMAADEQTYTAWMGDCSSGGTPVAITHKLVGAMADFSIEAAGIGKPLMVHLKLTGKNATPVDVDNATLATLGVMTSPDTSAAYVLLNATLKIATIAKRISKFKIDAGHKVTPAINSADATGFDYYTVSGREPRLSINPLKEPVATYDAVSTAIAGTGATVTLELTGPTYPLKITFANAQLLSPAEEEREGRIGWNMTFKGMRNGTEGALKVAGMLVSTPWEILQGTKS